MIRDYISHRSMLSPEKLLFILHNEEITYNDFNLRINDFLFYLRSNFPPKSRSALNLSAENDILAALVGCNRAGVIPILLPPESMRVAHINYVKISDADNIITRS